MIYKTHSVKDTHFALVAYQGHRDVLLSILMAPEIPDDLFAKEGDGIEPRWQIILDIDLALYGCMFCE